jgi:hypothetical protein
MSFSVRSPEEVIAAYEAARPEDRPALLAAWLREGIELCAKQLEPGHDEHARDRQHISPLGLGAIALQSRARDLRRLPVLLEAQWARKGRS